MGENDFVVAFYAIIVPLDIKGISVVLAHCDCLLFFIFEKQAMFSTLVLISKMKNHNKSPHGFSTKMPLIKKASVMIQKSDKIPMKL